MSKGKGKDRRKDGNIEEQTTEGGMGDQGGGYRVVNKRR